MIASLFLHSTEFSMEKAKKIDTFFQKIAKIRGPKVFLKKKVFTQSELNAYFNLIYTKKYAPEVKYVNLKLEKNNMVSGEMRVKLTGEKYSKVPSFLKEIEVEFSGEVQCENYRMRYVFDDLYINGTAFSPEILDEAFGAAQAKLKVKKSIFDWFNFLPGIKSVVIDYKKITVLY